MKKIALTLGVLLLAAAPAAAQVVPRWQLDWKNDKPELYSHRDVMGNTTSYWWFTYEVTNPTEEIVPILLDIMVYSERGSGLVDDLARVDTEGEKEKIRDPKKYEEKRFGRYYMNVITPEVEYRIIEIAAKLTRRNPEIIKESIEALKQGNRYLNAAELSQRGVIMPGQTLHGVAIFKGIDPRSQFLEVQVSGLVDIVKVEKVSEEEIKMSYENQVYKVHYLFPGDATQRERDVVTFESTDWVVRRIGPLASKDSLQTLVDALVERIRREQEWDDLKVPVDEREARRRGEPLTPHDIRVTFTIFFAATGINFGYDGSKDILANKDVVARLHEWWVIHKGRLRYNDVTNRFELEPEAKK